MQWCRRGGVQGVQAHPQKFWFVQNLGKIPETFGKISENLGKIPENPNKIPKYLGKIPENLGKNGTQRCLTSKNGDQSLQKSRWRPFFGGHSTKMVGKSCTTTFWASLGKFGQKSFAPPKICLLLHLCRYATELVGTEIWSFCQHAQFYFAERRGLSWFNCWKSHHENAEENSTACKRLNRAVYRFLHVLEYQHINYTLEWYLLHCFYPLDKTFSQKVLKTPWEIISKKFCPDTKTAYYFWKTRQKIFL